MFKDEADYLLFLEGIMRVKKKHPFKIHALCLMTNHFHMAIETEQVELWKIMSKFLHPYAMNFNRKYNYTGHLFENRYVAQIIEDERYFLEVSRYIHLNPVKAQMVRNPLDYEYSSYRNFIRATTQDYENFLADDGKIENNDAQKNQIIPVPTKIPDPREVLGFLDLQKVPETRVTKIISELVDTSRVLGCFKNNPTEQYRMFVEGKISHAEQELLIQKDMKEDDMWLPW